ncbi:MAG: flagellar motor switch protein FliN [Lentisphaerae bacterium]|nr:MAG: flagellar motor switch protein FliN [Lentisphaerota bacterium]
MSEENQVNEVEFAESNESKAAAQPFGENTLKLIAEIPVRLCAELGHTKLPIRELLALGAGSVVELDRQAGESIDLLVNGVLIGRGDVVIVNENFAVRITELVTPEDRLNSLKE